MNKSFISKKETNGAKKAELIYTHIESSNNYHLLEIELLTGRHHQIRAQLALVLEAVLSQVLLPRADGSGRIAAFEIMLGTYAIGSLIREARTYELPSVIEMSSRQGMQSLDQSLRRLIESGLVTLEEALSRAHKPQELRSKLLHTTPPVRRGR